MLRIIAGCGKLVNSSYGTAALKILGLTLNCLLMYFSSFRSTCHHRTLNMEGIKTAGNNVVYQS